MRFGRNLTAPGKCLAVYLHAAHERTLAADSSDEALLFKLVVGRSHGIATDVEIKGDGAFAWEPCAWFDTPLPQHIFNVRGDS